MKNILDKLSSSLNRRDEFSNQELAYEIVNTNDINAVTILVENLSNRNKNIQNDCIKVLYEIGEKEPSMIEKFWNEFLLLLDSSNNRMVWGAMSAINTIVKLRPAEIFEVLPKLMDIANKGSVITKDQTVAILIKLCSLNKYKESVFPLFIELLEVCPTNQLPMYAENAMPIIDNNNKSKFVLTLKSRLGEIEKDTKRIRIEKIIKKLG